MLRRRGRSDWLDDGERALMALLLAGEHPTLAALRRQIDPQFILRVRRVDEPRERTWYFDFDGDLRGSYAAGRLELLIDDLWIEQRRQAFHVVGKVMGGVIGPVHLQVGGPVRWPKHLAIEEHWYVHEGERRADRHMSALGQLPVATPASLVPRPLNPPP